jgi:paraquat-inducible protein B
MSDSKNGFGSGILKGLKNLLFKEDAGAPVQEAPATPPAAAPAPAAVTPAVYPVTPPAVTGTTDKDMKLKVYQLLESLNQPGCDFFEVWNAAGEMGGANSTNIKAAFTSLRFADKTLTKDKLLQTGAYYRDSLKNVLQTETQKREDEKTSLHRQKEQAKTGLDSTISSLEKQITDLQQQLQVKKTERSTLDEKYNPSIAAIDIKITQGQQSVNSVLAEMQEVLDIIQKDIN